MVKDEQKFISNCVKGRDVFINLPTNSLCYYCLAFHILNNYRSQYIVVTSATVFDMQHSWLVCLVLVSFTCVWRCIKVRFIWNALMEVLHYLWLWCTKLLLTLYFCRWIEVFSFIGRNFYVAYTLSFSQSLRTNYMCSPAPTHMRFL